MATLLLPVGRVSMRPRSTTGEAALPFPSSIIGSLTLKLSVSTVVVVPSTVKLPVTLRLDAIEVVSTVDVMNAILLALDATSVSIAPTQFRVV